MQRLDYVPHTVERQKHDAHTNSFSHAHPLRWGTNSMDITGLSHFPPGSWSQQLRGVTHATFGGSAHRHYTLLASSDGTTHHRLVAT